MRADHTYYEFRMCELGTMRIESVTHYNHFVQLHSILPFNSSISWRCCRLSLFLVLLPHSRRSRLSNLLYRQVFFCTHVFERWTFSVWLFKALKSLSKDTVTHYWIAETDEMEKRAIVYKANERVSEWVSERWANKSNTEIKCQRRPLCEYADR